MNKWFKILILVLCSSLICLSLTGCGSNLFALEDETYDNLDDQLANAETEEELEAVITDADVIIDNPDSSTEDVQEALIIKGEAILEQQGVETGEILSALIPLIEQSEESGEEIDIESINIFELIDVSAYDEEELALAAEAFNGADSEELLAALLLGRISSSVEDGELSDNDQFYRGICNMIMVMKLVDLVYEVETSGNEIELIARDENQTSLERLTVLMDPSTHEDVSGDIKSIDFYASNAVDAFTQSDTFDEDVLDDLSKIEEASDNIAALYAATQCEGDPDPCVFTINSTTYDFNTEDTDDINTNIEDALVEIFEDISI
jgi:hypothetical protein